MKRVGWALAAFVSVSLVAVGAGLVLRWRSDVGSSVEIGEAIGQQRMLVASTVELTVLLEQNPGLFPVLLNRTDLLTDHWAVISGGGIELGLDLRPTGREFKPWEPAQTEFGDVAVLLDELVDAMRRQRASGAPTEQDFKDWHDRAEVILDRLALAARHASDIGRFDRWLVLGASSVTMGLLLSSGAWLTALGARRRRLAATIARAMAGDAERARFERVLDQSPDALIVLDRLGEVAWCSAGLGLGPDPNRAALRALVHSDDIDAVVELVAHAFLSPLLKTSVMCRLSTPNGSWRVAELIGRNLLDDDLVNGVVIVVRDVSDREAARADQRRLGVLRAFLTEHASEVMIQLDSRRHITYATPAIGAMFELRDADVKGVPFAALVAAEHRQRLSELLDEADSTGAAARGDLEMVGASNDIKRWVSASFRVVIGKADEALSYHVSLIDIEDRRAAEQALAESEHLHRLILDTLGEGVVLTHREHGVVAANRAATELTGVRADVERGSAQVLAGATQVLEIDGAPMNPGDSPASRVFASGRADLDRHLQMCWPDGSITVNAVNSIPCGIGADGSIESVLSTFADVTLRLQAERELARLATLDSLTLLPNRRQLEAHLEQALARHDRSASALVVFFVDLDRFKAVNDTYGHRVGDELLVAVGERITCALRVGDFLARIGGDEFVIVVESCADASALRDRIAAALNEPFELSRCTVHIGGSVGEVEAGPGSSVSGLLAAADAEMYRRKRTGRVDAS